MVQRRITDEKVAFLQYEFGTRDARRQKAALQDICRLYRNGAAFAPEARHDFEIKAGYLANNSSDQKVVRWSLNAIARLGTQQGAANSVEDAMRRHAGRPEIEAAAIAALASLFRGQLPKLPPRTEVPPEIRVLAAMQTVSAAQLEDVQLNINIDTADHELLKLALIVIGLNKDIQHLLHPRHENGTIVKALGEHDNAIVRQYCVWAVIENRRLGLDHLGTAFNRLEKEPDNVQAKLLELGASTIPDPTQRQEFIIEGSNLSSVLAREGLAKGLLHSFYDGVEGITLDWFRTEHEPRVKVLLAEHFARFSDQLPSYEQQALELAEQGGDLKRHVLLGADGKPLHRKLKESRVADRDLFGLEDDDTAAILKLIEKKNAMQVLVLNAMPDDEGRIRPDKEAAVLRERMAGMKNPKRYLEFENVWATQLDQIQQELIRHEPSILHFSGHGAPGTLVFERSDGTAADLDGKMLARILKGYGRLECLVLHACYAEEVAKACLQYVPVVVGSIDVIDDETAPKFSYIFYQGIAAGMDFQQAFEMGQTEVAIADTSAADTYKLLTQS